MKTLRLLFILQIVVHCSCFAQYESFLKKLTHGLDQINRENDYELKHIEFNSSEDGEKHSISFEVISLKFLMFCRYSREAETKCKVRSFYSHGSWKCVKGMSA